MPPELAIADNREESSGFGGAEGDRTPDLMSAIHALSQLSYSPEPRDRRELRCLGYPT